MCGIVGSYHPTRDGGSLDLPTLNVMRDKMFHRGPDGADSWRSANGRCALGHRRLSIIDLSDSASQPMQSEDGNIVLVFNGEIYNHAEIREELIATGRYRFKTDHSDTETLLYAYAEWGKAFVHRLYGMYAFVIYDTRDRHRPVMHMVRDRAGVKPLYFTRTSKGEWVFASEIKAILPHPDVHKEMDKLAFWHYLSFIVAPAPLTMFRDIFKIPAGHWVTIDSDGNATTDQYWDCAPKAADTYSESDLSYDEAVDQLTDLMRTSIQRRMVSDVPFGVLLSGGVDSSLNVALMSELMDRPVDTFTVGYSAYKDFNEYDHAKKVSKRYKTNHHETRIDAKEALAFLPKMVELQDEPIADNVCIPLYFLSKLVKDSGTTVVQVGEGADENFLGYWWCDHYKNKAEGIYDPIRAGVRNDELSGLINKTSGYTEDHEIAERAVRGKQLFWGGAICWWGGLREQLTPSQKPFDQRVNCPVKGMMPEDHQFTDSHGVISHYLSPLDGNLKTPEIMQKIPYMEMKLRIPEHLLMRVDKMTMANSIEARVPFLDHDMVEFARTLPPSYKLHEGLGKKILKKVAEPYVDHKLLYRRKQGFGAPIDKWFSEDVFGEKCLAAFRRSQIREEGFFDNDYVENLLKSQIDGTLNYGFHLWTLMNAILWHEHWIGGGLQDF